MALAFSAESEAKIQSALSECYNPQAALLPVLYIAVEEFGSLTPEVLDLVAGRLDLPRQHVEGVATFYTMYPRQARGRYHIQVCRTLSCALMGGPRIVEHLETRLGIKPGEVTPDGTFSLEEVECLALCGGGPAMLINQTPYENLTVESVDLLLARLT